MKKVFCLVLTLIMFTCFVGCSDSKPKSDKPTDEKNVIVEVVHKDKSVESFEIKSSEKYLGDALEAEKLIEGKKDIYGLFITTVDEETVNSNDEEWWCVTKDKEAVMTGISSTPFEDGDKFEITFTVGYTKQ